jgi:hypothetical protein
MKKILFSLMATSAITIISCNNSSTKNEPATQDINKTNPDSSQHTSPPDGKEVKAVAITYTDVDTKSAASIKEIVDHYLHVKNALANDNGREAASGAKAMAVAINKLDKSLLSADQKKVYDGIEDDLKDHAEHISKNGDNIKHQRSHFSMMSEDVYGLVKAFGGGRPLYHDHCPMYNENKGAMWLSEMKEVSNPYFGSEMLTCGTVEEVIK